MLAMGLEPPFIVTADDFEEIAFLLRSEGRRKAARSLKLLADKGIVASLPKHVFKLARAFNTVSPAVRAKIFERDKVCRLCGAEHGLTIDHITARCLGGENVEENLQVLCLTCNTRKAVEERREAARRANA